MWISYANPITENIQCSFHWALGNIIYFINVVKEHMKEGDGKSLNSYFFSPFLLLHLSRRLPASALLCSLLPPFRLSPFLYHLTLGPVELMRPWPSTHCLMKRFLNSGPANVFKNNVDPNKAAQFLVWMENFFKATTIIAITHVL